MPRRAQLQPLNNDHTLYLQKRHFPARERHWGLPRNKNILFRDTIMPLLHTGENKRCTAENKERKKESSGREPAGTKCIYRLLHLVAYTLGRVNVLPSPSLSLSPFPPWWRWFFRWDFRQDLLRIFSLPPHRYVSRSVCCAYTATEFIPPPGISRVTGFGFYDRK